MDPVQKLNDDIRTARGFIRELESDTLLNSEILVWMEWMLKGLEFQRTKLELLGFDSQGNMNSFHALTINQN